jgi:hypothetical protein
LFETLADKIVTKQAFEVHDDKKYVNILKNLCFFILFCGIYLKVLFFYFSTVTAKSD